MGWESAVTSGVSSLNAVNQMNTAQAQAQAQVTEGEQKASNQADDTLRAAGKLQTSFLQSGIALDDGPNQIIQMAFAKGSTDIQRTITNTNNQAANTVSAARTAALNTIAQGVQRAGYTNPMAISDAYQGSWLQDGVNGLGQDVGSMFDPSPTGPYLPFGI